MESSSAGVLEVDLADLVVPKQVAVVQELDLGKLSATLQAIVDAVNSRAAAGQDDAPTKGDFEALQKELEKLRQDVDGKDAEIKELKAEQEKLTEQLGDKIGKGDLDPKGILDEMKKQDERLSKLDGGGGASGGAEGAGNGKQGLAPRVDEMSAELKALQDAVKAAKDAAEDAAARAALALKSAGGGPALQPDAASSEAESGAAAAAASALAAPAGPGAPAATVARVEGLALDLDVLAKKQKDLEGRLAKHEADQGAEMRGVQEAQEALRKASREAANAAEDARSAGGTAGKRLGEAEGQLGALRAAVEALNNGEKIELPAPVAAPAPVDLGPLERRVSQKADADDLTAAEKRLEKLEAAVREAREAADAAEGRGTDADREMRELKAALSRLEGAQQQQQQQQGGFSGQAGGAPGSVIDAGGSAAGNEGTQHHHHHHNRHESDRSHTADSNSNSNNSTKELSEIRSELRELKSTMETLLEKAQGAAKGGDLSDLAAEVEALRKGLAGKASQADVDALLGGGALSGAASAAGGGAAGGGGGGGAAARGAAAAEVDPSAATTESLAVTINEMKLQLNSLQGFLSVLQGRMDGKASAEDVDSLRRGHQSISEKIVNIENRLDEVNKVSNATKELTKQVSSIEKRLSAVEARPAPGGTQQGAAPGAGQGNTAAPAAASAAAAHAAAMDGNGIGALEERLRQAMADIAELRSMMSEVTAMRSAVSGAERLRGEVDSGMASLREEVTAMHGSLAAKADKAELDALLEAGLPPTAGGAAADSGGAGAASAGLSESADTKDIVALLNDLAGRVASLSATQKVLQERLSGKADAAALDAKANRDSVAKLEAALAAKASQDALDAIRDELARLKAQVAGAQQMPSQAPHAPSSASGGLSAEHLAAKADRSELRELQNALGSLAAQIGAGGPALLGMGNAAASAPHPPSGNAPGNAAERSPRSSAAAEKSGNAGGGSNNSNGSNISDAGLADRLAALEGDVGRLASALEIVAHAANTLAVGEAHAMTPISGPSNYAGLAAAAGAPGAPGAGAGAGAAGAAAADQNALQGGVGNQQAPPGASANGLDGLAGAGPEANGNGNLGGAAAAGLMAGTGLASAKHGVVFGKDGIPRGAVDKLRDMHANRFYNRKMDWFDPEWLQDLARRVGDVESSVRALKKANNSKPATSGNDMPGRSAGGHKDYDKMIMKLGRDIANLRKQLGDMAAGGGGGGMMGGGGGLTRVPDGDHAMLSSKPLLGYRCMACDRPLEKLDEKPGPYVPSNQMPVNVAPYERRGIGQPVGHDSPPKPMHQPVPSQEMAAARGARAGADGRGPQNWYQDVHGKPASYLPAHDVGPVLPRGGWRGNETGAPVQAGRGGYHQVDKLPSLMEQSSSDGYSSGQRPQQPGGMASEGSLPPIGQ